MVFYLSLDVPRDPRSIRLPRGNVTSRNGAHSFGVCCIIRTGERKRKTDQASSKLIVLFFFFPVSWKTSFGNILPAPQCRPFEFSDLPLLQKSKPCFRKYPRTKLFRSKPAVYLSFSIFFNRYHPFRNLTSKNFGSSFSSLSFAWKSNRQGDGSHVRDGRFRATFEIGCVDRSFSFF